MLPNLPPEILGRIAQVVKGPVSRPNWIDRREWSIYKEAQVQEERDVLLSLMKSSKVSMVMSCQSADTQILGNAAAQILDGDCRVGKVESFLRAVEAGRPCDKIKRLQLYHPAQAFEPSYEWLIERGRRNTVALKSHPVDQDFDLAKAAAKKDVKDKVRAGARLRTLLGNNSSIFPALQHLVLGGLGETSTDVYYTLSGNMPYMKPQTLPITLLDIPSLETVCQYYGMGTLVLPGLPIQPRSRLRIFTYHPRPFPAYLAQSIEHHPIIIGAVNRYYHDQTFTFRSTFDQTAPESRNAMLDALHHIISWLHPSRTLVVTTTADRDQLHEKAHIDNIDLRGTTIEIYNHIRVADWGNPKTANGKFDIEAPVRALPLVIFQKLLDSQVHPKWRGRVVLRDMEDTPPCASCGYLPEEEDEHMMVMKP